MIQLSAERRDKSIPVTRGFRTSAFGLPFGFMGKQSHFRARLPGMSNGPFLFTPRNATDLLRLNRAARVRSTLPFVRSAWMRTAGVPFRKAAKPAFLRAKQTNDTRTAVPSTVQGSSAQASKITPRSTIWSSTVRFHSASYGVGRNEAGTGDFAFGYQLAGFLEPVTHKIRRRGNLTSIGAAQTLGCTHVPSLPG